jgi:myo-inositol-1(or 4)-monophosphatase
VASYVETASEIAREAGALLLDFYRRRIGYDLKGEADLVTEADRASERLVVERLQQNFPEHSVVGEEGGEQGGTSEYRWYVDPLDGTTNFAHGFPIFNVCLGLQRAGEPLAGVVYDPTRDELFAAERGSGAFLNGARIHVSNVEKVENALVATGFPSWKRHQNVNFHFYYQMALLSHGVRRGGSAAIDLAYVACGRLEAFWEVGLKPWDMAAGSLLVTEAGGRISDMNGQFHTLASPHLLSDNGLIHEEMLALFAEIFAGNQRFPLVEMRRL